MPQFDQISFLNQVFFIIFIFINFHFFISYNFLPEVSKNSKFLKKNINKNKYLNIQIYFKKININIKMIDFYINISIKLFNYLICVKNKAVLKLSNNNFYLYDTINSKIFFLFYYIYLFKINI